jgi:hypothetical protein
MRVRAQCGFLNSLLPPIDLFPVTYFLSPMSRQHNVGCDQEPKRIVTYKRNINEYRNDREPRDKERNYMYAENVEHR